MASNIATMGCATFVACGLLFGWLFSLVLSSTAALIAGGVCALVLGVGASFYVGWRDAMRRRGLDVRGRKTQG